MSREKDVSMEAPDFHLLEPTIQDFFGLSDSDVAETPVPKQSREPTTILDYLSYSTACAATVAGAFEFDVAYFASAQWEQSEPETSPNSPPGLIYDLLAAYGPFINFEVLELPGDIGRTALEKGSMECYKTNADGTKAMYCYALAVPNCSPARGAVESESHKTFTVFAGFQILVSNIAHHSPIQQQSRRDLSCLIERSSANLQRLRAATCSSISG